MGSSISVPESLSVHDFTVKDSKGKDVDLSIYKGKVLLIVNVASKCGLQNSNYTQLTELYRKYKDQGFEILAFPCNQFLQQAPGPVEEMVQFVCERFNAEYPIFGKVRVNGSNAAPLYKYLKANGGGFMGTSIKWNFTKFLISKQGNVLRRFGPTTEPSSMEIDIQKALEEPYDEIQTGKHTKDGVQKEKHSDLTKDATQNEKNSDLTKDGIQIEKHSELTKEGIQTEKCNDLTKEGIQTEICSDLTKDGIQKEKRGDPTKDGIQIEKHSDLTKDGTQMEKHSDLKKDATDA